MTAVKKKNVKKRIRADHNALYAGLILGIAILLMFNLIQYGIYQEQRKKLEKSESLLHAESLKRDYFEWRESKSTGHTVDKSAYPKWEELVELGVTKQ